MTITKIASLCLTLLLCTSGCDLISGQTTIVSGTAVDADTGAPIEGIEVTLRADVVAWGPPVSRAQDVTIADGSFYLRYDTKNANGLIILFANYPFFGDEVDTNRSYDAYYDYDIRIGKRYTVQVELEPKSTG